MARQNLLLLFRRREFDFDIRRELHARLCNRRVNYGVEAVAVERIEIK